MPLAFLNPTGGLVYHLRALRSQGRLWGAFREDLYAWLSGWRPPERNLLLVGPSGGYCLDRRFLARFERLSAVDPDPLAKRIFRRRFGIPIDWSHEDFFSPRDGKHDPLKVRALLERYPAHAVLFCNFLGQLPFLDTRAAQGESYASWKRALPAALEGRGWASFHDRLSGELRPRPARVESPGIVTDPEIVDSMYPDRPGSKPVELWDHLTGDLFPGRPRSFMSWEIAPGRWHLIEAVRS